MRFGTQFGFHIGLTSVPIMLPSKSLPKNLQIQINRYWGTPGDPNKKSDSLFWNSLFNKLSFFRSMEIKRHVGISWMSMAVSSLAIFCQNSARKTQDFIELEILRRFYRLFDRMTKFRLLRGIIIHYNRVSISSILL